MSNDKILVEKLSLTKQILRQRQSWFSMSTAQILSLCRLVNNSTRWYNVAWCGLVKLTFLRTNTIKVKFRTSHLKYNRIWIFIQHRHIFNFKIGVLKLSGQFVACICGNLSNFVHQPQHSNEFYSAKVFAFVKSMAKKKPKIEIKIENVKLKQFHECDAEIGSINFN